MPRHEESDVSVICLSIVISQGLCISLRYLKHQFCTEIVHSVQKRLRQNHRKQEKINKSTNIPELNQYEGKNGVFVDKRLRVHRQQVASCRQDRTKTVANCSKIKQRIAQSVQGYFFSEVKYANFTRSCFRGRASY